LRLEKRKVNVWDRKLELDFLVRKRRRKKGLVVLKKQRGHGRRPTPLPEPC
jgi:hypothetical protein